MRIDPHSYADLDQGTTRHVELEWVVDMVARRLKGVATLTLHSPGMGPLDLDSSGLQIHSIEDDSGPVRWTSEVSDPIVGTRLRVHRERATNTLRIRYHTCEASGLMWLDAAQTSGTTPFVLSQCQPIQARSLAPLQDTPRARMTYSATLTVPPGLTAVMSAAPGIVQEDGRVRFEMPQPIPPYLLALAVGDLEFRDLGPRTRVFAEPAVIEAAAWEFADVERMLETAESLFGPYAWERFDFIVLPASFPLGGMENPRMTFLTPTLVAGDRSLVGVLAHELAHSWTGNLVTNADNEHFWLNEGWTVYAERRILQALYGTERATQAAALGRQHLDRVIELRQAAGNSTALTYSQAGLHPDDEFSQVPYEKGFLLITALEQAVGREAFDAFIAAYIQTFRFQSIDTQTFVDFVDEKLGPVLDLNVWLHGEGLPEGAPMFTSERLKQLHGLAERWTEGARPDSNKMSVTEKLYYLSCLPVLDADSVEALDAALGLRCSQNAELRSVWLSCAARAHVASEDAAIREFVGTVGRTKLLTPIVRSLVAAERRTFAVSLIDANRERLHGSTVRSLTRWVDEAPSA